MGRCGCSDSSGCNCVVQGNDGAQVSGSGTVASPYIVRARIDPDPDNLITQSATGLLLSCETVQDCIDAAEGFHFHLYNVADYGAVGDGVTDDSGAIQDAIDAAAITGGAVVFPRVNL